MAGKNPVGNGGGGGPIREILNLDEACELLRVSSKTLAKVLRTEDLPARKIGREWRFSRTALIEWVGRGRGVDYSRVDEDEGETDATDRMDAAGDRPPGTDVRIGGAESISAAVPAAANGGLEPAAGGGLEAAARADSFAGPGTLRASGSGATVGVC
jgi:excisionase family DNA binding protein